MYSHAGKALRSFAESRLLQLRINIYLHQLFQDLITLRLHDQASGILMTGDVGGIPGHNISYDLVDRIISLLRQRHVDLFQDLAHIHLILFLHCLKILSIMNIAHIVSRPLTVRYYSILLLEIRKGIFFTPRSAGPAA